jgi:twitching motility protein PilT
VVDDGCKKGASDIHWLQSRGEGARYHIKGGNIRLQGQYGTLTPQQFEEF